MLRYLTIALFIPIAACADEDPERLACLKALKGMTVKGAHDGTVADLIGREGSAINNVPGYKSIRLLMPNSMMTMDYRTDRINIYTDCDGIVIATTRG
jgi:peptidase inhibitor I78 family protein